MPPFEDRLLVDALERRLLLLPTVDRERDRAGLGLADVDRMAGLACNVVAEFDGAACRRKGAVFPPDVVVAGGSFF